MQMILHLLVSGKDVHEIETMLGQELGYVSEWLDEVQIEKCK